MFNGFWRKLVRICTGEALNDKHEQLRVIAAEREFEETAVALAQRAKAEVSEIKAAPLLGQGRAQLVEEARQRREAIERAVKTGTMAAMMAADAIAGKHGLSRNQRDEMIARFSVRSAALK